MFFAMAAIPALLLARHASADGSLDVRLFAQKQSMWCWAASGQMIMTYISPANAPSQCKQANVRFGRTDCCASPTPEACDDGGWPEFDKYGFSSRTTSWGYALTQNQVKSQIDSRRTPFAFAWGWNGGGGHIMVGTGWSQDADGVMYVTLNNPGPVGVGEEQTIPYDEYVGGDGYDHSHQMDYYDITRNTGVTP
ncbi:hypothetical protein LVJ94_04185 [Pendulispora rubella]|uniref:Papain-like cysteine protease AvrRpt2 n=1 Tax=Pendulispora rubella TaxID=2741070 RepID=A0ABZ2L674_9BACT